MADAGHSARSAGGKTGAFVAPFEAAAQVAALLRAPLITAAAYFVGAAAAFLVGTLSDNVYAPFWPPNVILFCGLLLSRPRDWPLFVAAVFPFHYVAETWVGMPPVQMLVAFATNCSVAVLAAFAIQRLGLGPDWFGDVRRTVTFIVVAFLAPAVAALGGAFVPVVAGAPPGQYPLFWAAWFAGNALGFLTLAPVFLTWVGHGPLRRPPLSPAQIVEAGLVSLGLVLACAVSFRLSADGGAGPFEPAILYLPLPFITWATVRLGVRGASAAVLVVTVVSTWSTLNGPSVFLTDGPTQTVVALQLFLMGEAVLMLVLGTSIGRMRKAEAETRRLAGSLMRVQDEERRRIARELHDSTGQQLIAALMLSDRIAGEANGGTPQLVREQRELLERSVDDIRTASYLLHPPLLDEAGLGVALKRFLEGYEKRTGVRVKLDLAPNLRALPQEVELAFFRVVQEALTNVSRHSRSDVAQVSLSIQGKWGSRRAVLTVEDYGIGIPGLAGVSSFATRGDFRFGGGVGLSSMAERLRQVGGRLEISSRVGRTLVRAEYAIAESGDQAGIPN